MSITNANLKTPGVYIREVSLLPPSVVQVSTAIPVFLGYTEKGDVETPTRITSLKEFEDTFGTGFAYQYDITSANDTVTATVGNDGASPTPIDFPEFGTFFFYEAIRMYFLNGGGACHIISVGHHPDLTQAITLPYVNHTDFTGALDLIDKMDEPTIIAFPEAAQFDAAQYELIVQKAMNMAADLQDKFVLVDSLSGDDLRDPAAQLDFRDIITPFASSLSYGAAYFPHMHTALNYTIKEDASKFNSTDISSLVGTAGYAEALSAMAEISGALIPPSPMIAGIYAQNDSNYGVWKAPANVTVQAVKAPEYAISDTDQEKLNVDIDFGKSINAIRTFTGRGDLVWGARTLAGNDNEWRYIQVRRLFMTVEESIKKAIQPFVFENNDAKTWVKVSAMISSYLDELWKEGALMGTKADEAYFVQVGLGTTMTQDDINAGRMIVKVGLAAVRPAEFIVLEFSHLINQ